MTRTYQICTRCVMDTSDPEITFDEKGQCNHCKQYDKLMKQRVLTGEEGQKKLQEIVGRIKKVGQGNRYDCVLGLSGGCDSTYVAYLAKQLRLRPYLISLDNGYDAEVTKRNIQRIADYLGTELHACRIDPQEVKEIQLAYLRSGVINIEAPTDHAILALLYKTAAREKVKFVLSGNNFVTEGILPPAWGYGGADVVNIIDIYNKYGLVEKLRTFPQLGIALFIYYRYIKGIQFISPLDYVRYVKKDARELFAREFGYEDYGPKHCESIITRFYQFYILPRRLNVDKRRAHLSCLVCSRQMTREEALKELGRPPYDEQELKEDKEYVLKRLGLTDEQFEGLISLPVRSHLEFKTDKSSWAILTKVLNISLSISNSIKKARERLKTRNVSKSSENM